MGHGPSRHMEATSTPGGANLTTQLRPGLMTTSTTHVRSLLTTTSGPKTAMSTRVAKPATTATLPLLTTPPTVLLTLRRLPLRATREHGLANTRTLMPMAVTRTSMRRSLTMTPAPKHTRPSLMMRGTTRMTTNGAHRLGVQTKMSTVLPLMELRPPRSRPATAARATATDLAMSGRAHLLRAALPEVPTTMTLTLTCLTVLTLTQDGASLTTPSLPDLTTTKNTPDGFRLTMTSGQKTTTTPRAMMPISTAKELPSGPSRHTDTAGAPRAKWMLHLVLATAATTATSTLTGMPMAATRILRSMSPTNRPGPSLMTPNPMTNGTTMATTRGLPRNGNRMPTSTVPHLTELLLPTKMLPMPAPATEATAMLDTVHTALLPRTPWTTVHLRHTPLPRVLMTTIHGPSSLKAKTKTVEPADPTTSSTPTSTTMSSTPAGSAPMMTNGPKTTICGNIKTMQDTALPHQFTNLNPRSPRPSISLMSHTAITDMDTVTAAGEQRLLCNRFKDSFKIYP